MKLPIVLIVMAAVLAAIGGLQLTIGLSLAEPGFIAIGVLLFITSIVCSALICHSHATRVKTDFINKTANRHRSLRS